MHYHIGLCNLVLSITFIDYNITWDVGVDIEIRWTSWELTMLSKAKETFKITIPCFSLLINKGKMQKVELEPKKDEHIYKR